jgi:hypothetical protein
MLHYVNSPWKCKRQLKIRVETQTGAVIAEHLGESQTAAMRGALDSARAMRKVSFTEFLDCHHPFLRQPLLDSIPPDNPPLETGEHFMRDVIFILVTLVFFAVAILYLRGCERLR